MRYVRFVQPSPAGSYPYPPPPPDSGGGKAVLGRLLPLLAAAALLLLLAVALPVGAQTNNDYDANDNDLIDIDSHAKLNAVRWDLDGDGAQGSVGATDWMVFTAAFPSPATNMGCGTTCAGYELTADLDLDTSGNGEADSADTYWDSGSGWTPIGGTGGWATTFDGGGHTISGLFINRTTENNGLFSIIASGGSVRHLGLPGVNITGGTDTGALAGEVRGGTVTGVFSTGRVTGVDRVGGLVGSVGQSSTTGSIVTSYSTASVTGTGTAVYIGGLSGTLHSGTITAAYATGPVYDPTSGGAGLVALVGTATTGGTITASYATGRVSGGVGGGLVDNDFNSASSTYNNNYYDRQTTRQSDTTGATPKTTVELQEPTGYEGIYAMWDVDTDGQTGGDDPWDFGQDFNYPLLKVDFDGSGTATWEEFGSQYRRATRPQPPREPYNWRTDHPESYQNARYGMSAACAVRTTGEGDSAVTTATITFDLGDYTRPVTLALSLWDRTHFRSLQSLGINMPRLQQQGQTATVEVTTNPARTRFRLDGQYGLNLVLGYADCHTDDGG